ncbi:MAG: hypothetical protein WAU01_14680 [Saprospiraceae bacterium]
MTQIAKITSLDNAKPIGLNLSARYWSPADVGETKRLYFIETRIVTHMDDETGETKDLNTAVFVDPNTKEVIHQASARLVAIFQREIIEPMTPMHITYRGKVKNTSNQYSSDTWEVYKLTVE